MVKIWNPTSGEVFKYPETKNESKFKKVAKPALGASVWGMIGFLFNDRANLGSNISDLKDQLEMLKNQGKDFSPCKTIDECNARLQHVEHIVYLDDQIISNCSRITGMTPAQLLRDPPNGQI